MSDNARSASISVPLSISFLSAATCQMCVKRRTPEVVG